MKAGWFTIDRQLFIIVLGHRQDYDQPISVAIVDEDIEHIVGFDRYAQGVEELELVFSTDTPESFSVWAPKGKNGPCIVVGPGGRVWRLSIPNRALAIKIAIEAREELLEFQTQQVPDSTTSMGRSSRF